MGENLDWVKDDLGVFSQSENEILKKICSDRNIPLRLVTKLLDVEQQMQGMSRRSSIYNRINEVFAEDWRSEEEIRSDMIKPDAVDSKRQIRHV